MRISDWSSDVCSSDLNVADAAGASEAFDTIMARAKKAVPDAKIEGVLIAPMIRDGVETIMGVSRDQIGRASCRERVCSVRVDLGGRRIIKKKKITKNTISMHEEHRNNKEIRIR